MYPGDIDIREEMMSVFAIVKRSNDTQKVSTWF